MYTVYVIVRYCINTLKNNIFLKSMHSSLHSEFKKDSMHLILLKNFKIIKLNILFKISAASWCRNQTLCWKTIILLCRKIVNSASKSYRPFKYHNEPNLSLPWYYILLYYMGGTLITYNNFFNWRCSGDRKGEMPASCIFYT